MKRNVIANAFSVNMLKGDSMLFFSQADLETVKHYISEGEIHSIVGHQSTADLLSAKLGVKIELNRENYKKERTDSLIVCLPSKRLDEGQVLSKEELEKIDIKFWIID